MESIPKKSYFAKELALRILLGDTAYNDLKRLMDPCCGTGVDKVITCSAQCDTTLCDTIDTCLGITLQGNASLILNQQGNWIQAGALQKVVDITATQLLNIHASPVELVSAPGSNKFIVVDKIIIVFSVGSIVYTNSGNSNTVIAGNNIIQFGKIFTSATNQVTQGAPISATLTANSPLVLSNTINEMANGNGTARIYIYYSINNL